MFVAGGDNGQYGSQIWVKRAIGYTLVAVEVLSSRLLFVTVALGIDAIVGIISGHAPCVDDAEQDRREFWEQLTAMTERMKRKWTNITLLLGIDANARVGSVRSQYIGTARPDRENANGTSFRHFLEATHIYAYNTYVDAGRTWVSPKGGKEARIDYVGSSQPPVISQNRPRVVSGIELATSGREDHRVVAADVAIMFTPP